MNTSLIAVLKYLVASISWRSYPLRIETPTYEARNK